MPVYDDNDYNDEPEDDISARYAWEITSWVLMSLTLVLNLAVILILLVRQNAYSVINKAILTLAIVDLLYGVFVSPFFVENYVNLQWDQSDAYCKFFEFYFTFHDFFVPLVLILLSTYISLKYAGATRAFKNKKTIYTAMFAICLLFSVFVSIPATLKSHIFMDTPPGDNVKRIECRTLDYYTMVFSYFLGSSLLFCFTMSFLFSLCIVGSPFLRDAIDREEYVQRWRLLLSVSLVNGFYIVSGFLLNFKEISRMFYECCEFREPFNSINSNTYEIWSFVLLIAEPLLRPLTWLLFYSYYLMNDPSMD